MNHPSARRPFQLGRPRYGVDAPAVPAVLAGTGVACSLLAARQRRASIPMAAAGAVLIANAGVYLHTTLHGKLRVWERELYVTKVIAIQQLKE